MKGFSKPFNLDTGTAVKVDGRFQEFPTEEEAWEFYKERIMKVSVDKTWYTN